MRKWSEQIAGMGRERQKNFLTYCQRLVRENFIYNFRRPELNYLTAQEGDFAKTSHVSSTSGTSSKSWTN